MKKWTVSFTHCSIPSFHIVLTTEWAPSNTCWITNTAKPLFISWWWVNKEASASHLVHPTWTLPASLSIPSLSSIHQHKGYFSTVIWVCHSDAQRPPKLHHHMIKSQVLAMAQSNSQSLSDFLSKRSPSSPLPYWPHALSCSLNMSHCCLKACVVALPLPVVFSPSFHPFLFSVQSVLRKVFPVFSKIISHPLFHHSFVFLHCTYCWVTLLFVHLPPLSSTKAGLFFFFIYSSFPST